MEEMQVFNSPAFPCPLFNRKGENMTTYFTKKQANQIIQAWQIATGPLPKKGQQLLVVWPNNNPGPKTCSITVHHMKSTYGELLYKFDFASDSLKNNAHKSNMSHDLTTVRPVA